MAEASIGTLSLLLCGIPATGKSTFGRWLQNHQEFLFVDLEANSQQENSLDQTGLRAAWEPFWRGKDRRAFPEALRRRGKSIALEWGFPVALLDVVVALEGVGLVPWWFEGDRLVARDTFRLRDRRPVELFDQQLAAVSLAWSTIEPVFAGRILRVAHPDGSFETSEAIYRAIVRATL